MGILGLLAKAFFAAFGDAVLQWLGQKRAERAQRDLGAERARRETASGTVAAMKRQERAGAEAARTEEQVIEALEQGRF